MGRTAVAAQPEAEFGEWRIVGWPDLQLGGVEADNTNDGYPLGRLAIQRAFVTAARDQRGQFSGMLIGN